jgi:hypothetical protein
LLIILLGIMSLIPYKNLALEIYSLTHEYAHNVRFQVNTS